MYKNIFGVLVCMMFIVVNFLPNLSGYNFIDELDQQQIEFWPYDENTPWGYVVFTDLSKNESQLIVQSFKPNLPILTRVKLWLSQGYEIMDCDLVISIRETLNGSDLTIISLSRDEIPIWPNYSWINCDFPDISVNIGQTYYIVTKSYCGQVNPFPIVYTWAYGKNTSYISGMIYACWNNIWDTIDTCDFCFETYGCVDSNEMIKIESISGGLGFSVIIKNNRASSVYDVNWSIDVDVGLGIILSGEHTEDVIDQLETGNSTTIKSERLRGIGPITITVQAADVVKQATAFLLGPLVLRVNEV